MEVSSGNWSYLGNFPNSKKLKITLKNLLWFSKNVFLYSRKNADQA